ncbi:hypothetical protein PENTCL1PPCAC_16554, partial [Pristionchus entomophagus]
PFEFRMATSRPKKPNVPLTRRDIENAHLNNSFRRAFPTWAVVTSPWARHPLGFIKSLEYVHKHTKEFEALDKEIRGHWESVKQPEWEYNCKVAFKNKLESILTNFLKRPLKLVITGSTVSGVGTANSDADICMCAPNILHPLRSDIENGNANILTRDERRRRIGVLLRRCKKALDDANLGLKIAFVDAMIPLLKMTGEIKDEVTGNPFNMEVDLSVSNEVFISGLHNSHLIRGYTRVDDRFAPLVTLVKKWSWMAGVRDPQKRRFNSYAMTLLVIHFLQCALPRPILPNLQGCYPWFFALDENNHPDKVDLEADLPYPLEDLFDLPPCRLSVAELFYLFVSYYSTIDLYCAVIRIKCGRISVRKLPGENYDEDDENYRMTPRSAMNHEVYIEDPIDEHNPGRTVDDWEMVRNCFCDALHVFNRVDDEEMSKIFSFPDLEDLTATA